MDGIVSCGLGLLAMTATIGIIRLTVSCGNWESREKRELGFEPNL
tara:strand:- start:201 stop:335 length:135 start_codon:yes stop_codon:yes gene_type:complete